MIEPKLKPEPIYDELTDIAEYVWNHSISSNMSYRGFHICSCGKMSDNKDWFTASGLITNSLMVHYIRDHRVEVPIEEIKKLIDDFNFIKCGENYYDGIGIKKRENTREQRL